MRAVRFSVKLCPGRAALKRHVKAVDDNLRIEWFFEDGDGTCGFGAFADTRRRKCGNEDNGHEETLRQQDLLQFKPVHPWHLYVGNDTVAVAEARRTKKIFGGCKRTALQPQ